MLFKCEVPTDRADLPWCLVAARPDPQFQRRAPTLLARSAEMNKLRIENQALQAANAALKKAGCNTGGKAGG